MHDGNKGFSGKPRKISKESYSLLVISLFKDRSVRMHLKQRRTRKTVARA
jgi:hypothetical protein